MPSFRQGPDPPGGPSSSAAAGGGGEVAEAADDEPMAPYRREELDLWYPTHKRLVEPAIHARVTSDIRQMLLTSPEIVARLRPPPTVSRATLEYLATTRGPQYDAAVRNPVEWAKWKTRELVASRMLAENCEEEWRREEERRQQQLAAWREQAAAEKAASDRELAARREIAASYGRKVAAYLQQVAGERLAEHAEKRAKQVAAAKAKRDERTGWAGARDRVLI